jgi:glycosyltransferase involved in cell wall biosynthesis
MKVSIGMLTWKRIPDLEETLRQLSLQVYKNFTLYISNGNLEMSDRVDKAVSKYKDVLNIVVFHDGNELKTFRRLYLGKKMAEDGADIILFIDDDIDITSKYVAKCVKEYEPDTYKSGFTWSFTRGQESTYYIDRIRRWDNNHTLHYAGTAVAAIDPKIFLEEGLFNAPDGAMGIEDLWLSYYANHVMGWPIKYLNVKNHCKINGADSVALYKTFQGAAYNKNHLLKELIDMGWQIKA